MGAHILLVEDSDLAGGALKVLFEASGFRVTLAASAEEAVRQAAAASPDLMLLDLGLPDADGLTVLRKLAERGLRLPTTLALTGSDDPGTVERCLAGGCRAVLLKPVAMRELLATVRRHAPP